MSEIFIGTSQQVTLDLSAAADAAPTATLINGTSTTVLSVSQVFPASAGYAETWSALIPASEIAAEGAVTVQWLVDISAVSVEYIKTYTVITPYVTQYEVARRLGIQFTNTDQPNYHDEDRILAAERVARMLIERQTSSSFGLKYTSNSGIGQQTDVLTLPAKIVSISEIYENDSLIYDVENDINEWGLTFVVDDSQYGVRISEPGIDYTEAERPSLVYSYGNFKSGYRYDVHGYYGFAVVPEEVKEAAYLLINDLLCQDSTYRTKYIGSVQVKDWKFSFNPLAYSGTGNAIADSILEKYTTYSIWVV